MNFFSHDWARRPDAPRALGIGAHAGRALLAVCATVLVLLVTAAGEARAAWQEVGSRNFAIIGGAVSIPVTRRPGLTRDWTAATVSISRESPSRA